MYNIKPTHIHGVFLPLVTWFILSFGICKLDKGKLLLGVMRDCGLTHHMPCLLQHVLLVSVFVFVPILDNISNNCGSTAYLSVSSEQTPLSQL